MIGDLLKRYRNYVSLGWCQDCTWRQFSPLDVDSGIRLSMILFV